MAFEQRSSSRRERFTFGVPLIAREAACDWGRVNDLISLTLRSVLAQGDRDFRLILAGHDLPPCWHELTRGDPRFHFLQADWPVERPSAANDDGGSKKWRIKEAVRREGGGLLMYLDADDLVGRNLVETARRLIGPGQVGGVIDKGFVIDFTSLCAAKLPDSRIFDGDFHHLCGSSTIARIEPDSLDAMRRDPHRELGSHHVWLETAAEAGVDIVRLPVPVGYLVNTDENHSENHGPYAGWRRDFNRAVRTFGRPIEDDIATRFGLSRALLEAKAFARAL
ncbi:hypothetical protein ATN84_01470 [Paramesorhizobium deserti]|uniref:Glycosyltransferase n=1 Tax=Paramesorhizobium deserti TaxID=1494590 RepID=A0A135HZ65_9HYPH|nr:hypothetical protein [Paramesorhizobium deserti]KXF78492.1 hypothetical protein ATN84_01470 [Paramesorhizobium deserti]